MNRLGIALTACFLTSSVMVEAQQAPDLPAYLVSRYHQPYSFADLLEVPVDVDELLIARLAFDTAEQVVSVDWQFRASALAAGTARDEYATSFQPTAVCRKAGKSDTFFVAGYVPRTGAVVLEEWVIDNPELHIIQAPLTDPPAPNPQPPVVHLTKNVRRSATYMNQYVNPIKTMFYNPVIDRLTVIFSGHFATGLDSNAYDIDVDSGTAVPSPGLFQHPGLQSHHAAYPFFSSANGFIVVLDRRPNWMFNYTPTFGFANQVMILRDADLSGVWSTIDDDFTWSEFKSNGWWENLMLDYEE